MTRALSLSSQWKIFLAMLLKQYKMLFQSRITVFTMLFGPLLIIFLIGFSFNTTGTEELLVGVVLTDSSEEIIGIADSLQEHAQVQRFQGEDDCKQQVIEGVAQACIVFGSIDENHARAVTIFTDSTQPSLAYFISGQITSQVVTSSDAISEVYAQDLINSLKGINIQISSDKARIENTLLTLEQLQANLAQVSSDADPVQYVPVDVQTALSEQLSAISAQSQTLTTQLQAVTSLQALLSSDQEGLSEELAAAQERYDECLDNQTDCTNHSMNIKLLQQQLDLVEDYNEYFEGKNFTLASTTITHSLQNLTSEAVSLQLHVNTLKAQLQQALGAIISLQQEIDQTTSSIMLLKSNARELHSSNAYAISSIGALTVTDAGTIATPLLISEQTVDVNPGTHARNLFPTLLALFIMLISVFMASTFVIIEKKSGAFIRNNIAPINTAYFPLTALIALASIVLAETLVITAIADLFFGISAYTQWVPLTVITVLSIVVFVLIGMSMAFFMDNEESIILGNVFITSTLMLFSSLIFPIQSMTGFLGKLALINPFVIIADLFKKALLFNVERTVLSGQVQFLIIYILLFSATYVLAYRTSVRKI